MPLLNGHAKEQQENGTGGPKEPELPKEEVTPKMERVVYIDEANTWIKNDGLLRDEGVLFGLSGADHTEKIQAIESYYEGLRAKPATERDTAKEQLDKGILELEEINRTLQIKAHDRDNTKAQQVGISTAKVARYLLGLTLMVIAAAGSFYLLHYYITPIYGLFATIGLYSFGLFAQMIPISEWLEPTAATGGRSKFELVKAQLLEIGPSVASTILSSYLVYRQSDDLGLCLALGFFLLFLFFFNGKLILGLSQTLVQEAKQYKKVRVERKRIKSVTYGLIKEIEGLEIKKKNQQDDNVKQLEIISASVIKLDELEKEKTNKVKLFLSEYHLAQHFSTSVKPGLYE